MQSLSFVSGATLSSLTSQANAALLGEKQIDLKNKRGLAIIIDCNYGDKYNAEINVDGDEMYKTMHQFNYDISRLQNENATGKNINLLLTKVNSYLSKYEGEQHNPDNRIKAIIFAFSGYGNSDSNGGDYIISYDDENIFVEDIVQALVEIEGVVTKIPKLFLFDACRGSGISQGARTFAASVARLDAKHYRNYCIQYATLPGYVAFTNVKWMQLIAKELRERDISFGDITDLIRSRISNSSNEFHNQLPDTLTRLDTAPLHLYYKIS